MRFNILIVSPFIPFPPDSGGRIRIYNLIRHLGREHEISLICPGEPEEPLGDLADLCREVEVVQMPLQRGWAEHLVNLFSPLPYSLVLKSATFRAELLGLLKRNRYHVVQFEFLPLAHYAGLVKGPKRLLVQHYMAHELRARQQPGLRGLKGLYYRVELPKIRRFEEKCLNDFKHIAVSTEAHRDAVRRIAPGAKVRVVPNGVDTERYLPDIEDEVPGLVTFMGAFHLNQANVEGLEFLLERVFPRLSALHPGVRLQVIGEGLPGYIKERHQSPDVDFLGYVEDERAHLARSQLLALPLMGGSGSKIRIPTALAMGKPVVATKVAAEGFEEHSEGIVLAESPEDMAQSMASLISDDDRRRSLGLAGRRMVEESFSWQAIAREVSGLYRSIVERG